MILCRVEWHRRWTKKRTRKCTAFLANPFRFTKQLLGQKHSSPLACSKEDTDNLNILQNTYSDAARGEDLGESTALINPRGPTTEEPSWKEIQSVVKAATASSAPGPIRVPYQVYKRCSKLMH